MESDEVRCWGVTAPLACRTEETQAMIEDAKKMKGLVGFNVTKLPGVIILIFDDIVDRNKAFVRLTSLEWQVGIMTVPMLIKKKHLMK